MNWEKNLRFDPLKPLLSSRSPGISLLTRSDLLDEKRESVESLWQLKEVKRIVGKQLPDGKWRYPSGIREQIRAREDYDQLETYRNLGILVEEYAMRRENVAISRAAESLFSHQTTVGDFRGIYGNQYSPNYSAGILELLIKAGYASDPRTEKGIGWLLSVRQDDGGWAIPLRTVGGRWSPSEMRGPTVEPNRSKPFSHLVTGVVLRAFAAHEKYRQSREAKDAGRLLASRFFKDDVYPDRRGPEYWTRFSYPFWFTDLLSSLDTLSLLGFLANEPSVRSGLEWFASKQEKSGVWNLYLLKGARSGDTLAEYVSLAVCRVFKRFYE